MPVAEASGATCAIFGPRSRTISPYTIPDKRYEGVLTTDGVHLNEEGTGSSPT